MLNYQLKKLELKNLIKLNLLTALYLIASWNIWDAMILKTAMILTGNKHNP